MAGPTGEALFGVATDVLGSTRAERCIAVASRTPLTRRVYELAAIAQLVVGTRQLSTGWWTRAHTRPFVGARDAWDPVTPDDWLAGDRSANEGPAWETTLWNLGWWIADDVAEASWGPFVDEVDINTRRSRESVQVPEGGVEGRGRQSRTCVPPWPVWTRRAQARRSGTTGCSTSTRSSTDARSRMEAHARSA